MHNVKEVEWRALESIEESVIQRVLGTLRSCPTRVTHKRVNLGGGGE